MRFNLNRKFLYIKTFSIILFVEIFFFKPHCTKFIHSKNHKNNYFEKVNKQIISCLYQIYSFNKSRIKLLRPWIEQITGPNFYKSSCKITFHFTKHLPENLENTREDVKERLSSLFSEIFARILQLLFQNSNLKNLKSFCSERDVFDCAGIRARDLRLPVNCSKQLSYTGVDISFYTGRPLYI